jgi:hypothetical protein
MAIATTMEQQALERKQVERWFVSHGVPHLMRNYSGRDRIPTLLCWLFLVVAFEVGAAPWLHMSAWRLLAAPLVLLIPAVAIAPRTIALLTTSRTRHVLWSLPVALYALWLAATIIRPGGVPNAWSSMWIDFPLVFGVLLTSAVLFRVETWQFNPSPQAERRRRTLIALIIGGVVVFSLEGSLVPGFHEPLNAAFSGVLPDDARLSQGVPALPLVGAILALAVRVTRDAWIDERPALDERTVAALVPAMPMLVLVLGIETTVLPHASKNEWVQATPLVPIALLLALAAVLWRHRTAVPLTTNRPGGRLHVTYLAIGAWLTLYLLTYPVLVLLYSEIDVYQHGLRGITGFAIALGVNLLYLGLTWFIVTFGLDRIAAWAFREAWRERGSVCEALFRGLPLLVLFATFFMFGAELWEAVVKAGTAEFLALLGVLLALTAAFMFTTSVREIHRRCHFASWGELACAIRRTDKPPSANDTPIVLMLQRIERNADPRPADPTLRLRGRQWINAMGVLTVYQALIFIPVLLGATAIFYVIADLLVPLARIVHEGHDG